MLHRVLFSLSVLSLSIASAHAAETYALDTPILAGIDNFREVAGITSAYSSSLKAGLRYAPGRASPGLLYTYCAAA